MTSRYEAPNITWVEHFCSTGRPIVCVRVQTFYSPLERRHRGPHGVYVLCICISSTFFTIFISLIPFSRPFFSAFGVGVKVVVANNDMRNAYTTKWFCSRLWVFSLSSSASVNHQKASISMVNTIWCSFYSCLKRKIIESGVSRIVNWKWLCLVRRQYVCVLSLRTILGHTDNTSISFFFQWEWSKLKRRKPGPIVGPILGALTTRVLSTPLFIEILLLFFILIWNLFLTLIILRVT